VPDYSFIQLKAAEQIICLQNLMLFYHHYFHLFMVGILMLLGLRTSGPHHQG